MINNGVEKGVLRIIPLGGLGEIGLNMMVFEYEDTLMVIDAGLMFPDDHMPGIDLVIPDFSYLVRNQDRLKALVLTHGHEDHIGAIPFLLKEVQVPVYGSAFTLALLKEKLVEHGLADWVDLKVVRHREEIGIGPFQVEFVRVNHSIVDGMALGIRTPCGLFIHSGDFKIDQSPVDGKVMDLNRFAAWGEEGVVTLLSDSTNVEREGFTLSEKEIGDTLENIFRQCPGRIIVALFASNIHRIQQVLNAAHKFGRKVIFNGKSVLVNTRLARDLGYLTIPPPYGDPPHGNIPIPR
jgi:ribonuclease J